MKRRIIGTAGHVDHGKTALVRALTGTDCDTHPAEKQRGITINLGFAHLDLPTGERLGIVDVPGHRDFVNTMVAGASGIDIAMMVVAADSGVMPQTLEHLQILQALGVETGLVVLGKIDLVDAEMLEIVEADVEEAVAGSFLEGCPVVRASAKSGQGLDDLRARLAAIPPAARERRTGAVFRMFVDRIFTIQGVGTAVTGSALSGELRKADTAYLLPGDRPLRVRGLQRHGEEVDAVAAGDRAALNLAGLKRDEFRRGMVVSDRVTEPAAMIDARLTLFPASPHRGRWSHAVFLLGAFETQARIHLLDRDHLEGGETGIVQLHLRSPCPCFYRDRFVIRGASGDVTLGGGEIFDTTPLHHKRRTAALGDRLRAMVDGGLPAVLANEVRKRRTPLTDGEIAERLNVSASEVQEVITSALPDEVIALAGAQTTYLVSRRQKSVIEEEVVRRLQTHHQEHPLEAGGQTVAELVGVFGAERTAALEATLELVLESMAHEGTLRPVGNTWAMASHEVALSAETSGQIAFVEQYHLDAGLQTPLMAELLPAAAAMGIDDKALKQILGYLVRAGKLCEIDGHFLHASVVDRCRTALTEHFAERPDGVTPAEFRDLIDGNRKICLLLLARFGQERLVVRRGDRHVPTGP